MTTSTGVIPRSLFIFSLIYGGLVTTAGVLGAKQVALGPLAVEAGILAFLPLVILSSAVAELHGTDTANRLVRFGFIPLIISMLLIQLVIALPPAPDMEQARVDGFHLTLGQGARLMFAGIIAYGTSQTLNVLLFDKLKDGVGKLLWLRGMIAAVLSQIIDTLLFISIAFYGVFPIATLMTGQIIAKVVLSILLVPILIQATVTLGRKLDAA
jgi:queuosine precursor transporter